MNEIFLNMYIIAVETGRLTIEFVPTLYRDEVKKVLSLE